METARHARPPGTPSRSLVALAAAALVAVTGVALWLLPAKPTADWDPPAQADSAPIVNAQPVVATKAPGPPEDGYVAFVDAVRTPGYDLAAAVRRTGVHHYALGHLTATEDGCNPGWGGAPGVSRNPVVDRLGQLRAAGGDIGLTFGGPFGDDPAVTCLSPDRLLAAYQRMIRTFSPAFLDFEIRTTAPGPTLRRATAIAALQREAAGNRRSLRVTFTMPATVSGLSSAAQETLRATHAAGAEISAVNLLIPFEPGQPRNLRYLVLTARAAHEQLGRALGGDAWARMGLVPVLVSQEDLGPVDARRLAGYRIRHGLAPLSVRGARPSDQVVRILNE